MGEAFESWFNQMAYEYAIRRVPVDKWFVWEHIPSIEERIDRAWERQNQITPGADPFLEQTPEEKEHLKSVRAELEQLRAGAAERAAKETAWFEYEKSLFEGQDLREDEGFDDFLARVHGITDPSERYNQSEYVSIFSVYLHYLRKQKNQSS